MCLHTTSFVYISEFKVRLGGTLTKLGHPPCLLTSRDRWRQVRPPCLFISRDCDVIGSVEGVLNGVAFYWWSSSGVFLGEKYSSSSLMNCTATCCELSVNLGKDNSLYWLVSTYVSYCALTISTPVLEFLTLLHLEVLLSLTLSHLEVLLSLTPFIPRELRLPNCESQASLTNRPADVCHSNRRTILWGGANS